MPPDLVGTKMETGRFYDAVNVILSLQVRIQPFKLCEGHVVNVIFCHCRVRHLALVRGKY
jgi:hypothetical protein